ncbi:MAG: hypothetical protein RL153_998 [Verrucomicrobiota bacterium]
MGEGRHLLVPEERDDAALQAAEAALDPALGLRAGRDGMADALGGQGALDRALEIASLGRGFVTEEGQAIGVEGHGKAHAEEDGAEVLDVVRGGVGVGDGGDDVFAGRVVEGEEEGLLGVGGRPGVDGGVVLPGLAKAGAFPTATRAGWGCRRKRPCRACCSGDDDASGRVGSG